MVHYWPMVKEHIHQVGVKVLDNIKQEDTFAVYM